MEIREIIWKEYEEMRLQHEQTNIASNKRRFQRRKNEMQSHLAAKKIR